MLKSQPIASPMPQRKPKKRGGKRLNAGLKPYLKPEEKRLHRWATQIDKQLNDILLKAQQDSGIGLKSRFLEAIVEDWLESKGYLELTIESDDDDER